MGSYVFKPVQPDVQPDIVIAESKRENAPRRQEHIKAILKLIEDKDFLGTKKYVQTHDEDSWQHDYVLQSIQCLKNVEIGRGNELHDKCGSIILNNFYNRCKVEEREEENRKAREEREIARATEQTNITGKYNRLQDWKH